MLRAASLLAGLLSGGIRELSAEIRPSKSFPPASDTTTTPEGSPGAERDWEPSGGLSPAPSSPAHCWGSVLDCQRCTGAAGRKSRSRAHPASPRVTGRRWAPDRIPWHQNDTSRWLGRARRDPLLLSPVGKALKHSKSINNELLESPKASLPCGMRLPGGKSLLLSQHCAGTALGPAIPHLAHLEGDDCLP